MKVAAYCRVSTGSDEQLNSLKNQTEYFESYASKHNYELYSIFADRGISGKSTNNRPEFIHMLECAKSGKFDMLLVKDISRFARNTVDFLNGIRLLKKYGVEVRFLSANQTVLGESEFVLTMFAALAQEESYNLSKRIIFGKHIAAQKGRTPCCVYGYRYDGKYNMTIYHPEAIVVNLVFELYASGEYGLRKIANKLNDANIPSLRGCQWQFKTIRRMLSNPIYTGHIVTNKSETVDFLTGLRKKNSPDEYIHNKDFKLRIVSDELYNKVQFVLMSKNAVTDRSC